MFFINPATFILNFNQVPAALVYCFIIIFLIIKYKQQQYDKSISLWRKLKENNLEMLPSPPTMPIIGHIHLLRDHQHNPWDGFDEIRKQFGNVVGLKMGIHQMVLVSSEQAMREILLKKGDIFSNRPTFPRHHIIFGGDKENSLALCNWSNTHRDRRKLCKRGIVPSRFSARNQLLEKIISKLVVEFVDNIEKHNEPNYLNKPNSKLINPSEHQLRTAASNVEEKKSFYYATKADILLLTSDIFMEFLCSETYKHSDSNYRKFVNGCDFVFWDINQSYLIDFLPFLTTLGVGSSYLRKLKHVTDFLRDYIDDKIFEPRKSKHIKLGKTQQTSKLLDASDDEDYLDSLIIEYLSRTTSMSLADYKVGFADLIAGHAAVANILLRLLGHLALNRDVQDKIYKESIKTDITNLDHKPHMPITEAAMQEALRIASSPIVPHVAREDTSIDQFYVPRGTMVLFNCYHLNLNDRFWKNPMEFDPMRFIEITNDNDSKEGPTYRLDIPRHFMPFSVGMRQCLGFKMVETTSILTVANLCRRYIIKVNDENLVRQLLTPKGSVALDPDAECFELHLFPR